MSTPTVKSVATWDSAGANAANIKATIGAGIVAGDLILVLVARPGQNGAGTIQSGWTALGAAAQGGASNYDAQWLYKIADGTESSTTPTVAVTNGADPCGSICIILTAETWGALAVAGAWSAPGSSLSPDPPSLTTGFGSTDLLVIEAAIIKTASRTFTPSTNYANATTLNTNVGAISFAIARRAVTAASEDPGAVTWSGAAAISNAITIAIRGPLAVSMTDTGAGVDALTVDQVGIAMDETGAGTDALNVTEKEFNSGLDDTGAGTDALAIQATLSSFDDTGAGTDDLSIGVQVPSFDDTGIGTDTFDVGVLQGGLDDTGTGFDALGIEAFSDLLTGSLVIGRFVNAQPAYTIGDQIINYEQIEEGQLRANVVTVDGEDDSWTEFDRGDLTTRDTAISAYFDLPELQTPGDVRQRAIEEIEAARRSNSPGGDAVWDPAYTRMDRIYWIDQHNQKYETRIEGISVEFNQSLTPFQRATIDNGVMVICPPDEASSYLVRDLFERETVDGLGTADTGGAWVVY